jgi:hypothetical protein
MPQGVVPSPVAGNAKHLVVKSLPAFGKLLHQLLRSSYVGAVISEAHGYALMNGE